MRVMADAVASRVAGAGWIESAAVVVYVLLPVRHQRNRQPAPVDPRRVRRRTPLRVVERISGQVGTGRSEVLRDWPGARMRRRNPHLRTGSHIARQLVAGGGSPVCAGRPWTDQRGTGAPAAAVLHRQAPRPGEPSRPAARARRAGRGARARRLRVGPFGKDEEGQCGLDRHRRHATHPGVRHDAGGILRRRNRSRPRARTRASRARRHLEGDGVRGRIDSGGILPGVARAGGAQRQHRAAERGRPRGVAPAAAGGRRRVAGDAPGRARDVAGPRAQRGSVCARPDEQPGAFISAMRRLGAQNLAEEHPSKLVQWLFYSHPPIRERIAAAEAFGAR